MGAEEEALAELRRILRGIDENECDSDVGWWETTGGAEFGSTVMHDLEVLIHKIFESLP